MVYTGQNNIFSILLYKISVLLKVILNSNINNFINKNYCFYVHWFTIFSIGPFMCELYGMAGSLFGCGSIWTMVMIALDRYNVIVKVKGKILLYI